MFIVLLFYCFIVWFAKMRQERNINLFFVIALLHMVNVAVVIAESSCSQYSSADSEGYWYVLWPICFFLYLYGFYLFTLGMQFLDALHATWWMNVDIVCQACNVYLVRIQVVLLMALHAISGHLTPTFVQVFNSEIIFVSYMQTSLQYVFV
mgnify:CR=1 FL=1